MLTRTQIDQCISRIPEKTGSDERRAAYSVITGFAEGKSVSEIASYYSLTEEVISYWMSYFDFQSSKKKGNGKRSSKTIVIEKHLAENVGKRVNFADLAKELSISVPTVYNFYNANRSYFKKIGRGNFEIIDPKILRANEK